MFEPKADYRGASTHHRQNSVEEKEEDSTYQVGVLILLSKAAEA